MTKTFKFADMTHEDRLDWLGSKVIETGNVEEVTKKCGRLFRQAGRKSEANSAFIMGDTGVGKSTAVAFFADRLAEQLQEKHPEAEITRPKVFRNSTPIRPICMMSDRHGFTRPLIVVVVPPLVTFRALMELTALAVGLKLSPKFTVPEATAKITAQLELQRTKIVVFDEVQHIVEGRINSYEAADVLKMVVKAQTQVVCVGLNTITELVEEDIGNDQLERLRQLEIPLEPFSCSLADFPTLDADGRPLAEAGFRNTPFRRLCLALDDRTKPILPFDQSSRLSSPEMAIRIWCASRGKTGPIIDLLFAATDIAIEKGLPCLTPKTLMAVYRDMGHDDADNWFKMDWARVKERFEALSVAGVYTRPKPPQPTPTPTPTRRRRGRPRNPLRSKQ